jgi:alkaline phosphatase D
VILVTRATTADPVRVRVWAETATPGEVVLVWDVDAVPNDGGYLRAEVTGLAPASTWRYGFFRADAGGAWVGRSDLGVFRTAPAAGSLPAFTVALMSCNGNATGRNDVVGRLAAHPEVDAVAHVGDMAYNDGAYTTRDYRNSWAEWMTSPGYRRGLATSALYATWDDHEVDNDWNPEAIDQAQLLNAVAAFTENVPLRAGPTGQLWGSHRWGDTAELFVLDCRTERRPSTRGQTDLYISRAQMDWLKAALTASTARFKLVLNSVPITGMPPIWDLAAADRWEGYPLQRDELLDHIGGTGVEGVWFLSGDFHVCFVSRIDPGAAGARGRLREVAVTSGNINPLGAALVQAQFAYNSSLPRLCTVTCDPVADEVTVKFYDPANDALVWERSYPRL